MQFVYPFVLWGLVATTIPIIIHLFRLRRFKTVLFSNTKLLRDVQLETRKKSRIKHLIILILRLLAIISIVTAFARPFLPRKNALADTLIQKTVIIYIDNSFSMEAGEGYHSRLMEAKNAATDIVSGFSPSDRFILLNNWHDASSFRTLTQKQFNEKISQLQISPFSPGFNEIIIRFTELLSVFPDATPLGFVISDFQNSFFQPQLLPDSLPFQTYLIPIEGSPVYNAGVDSVWLDSPVIQSGRAVTVFAGIKNYSEENYINIPVELYVNDVKRSVASCDLSPGGRALVEMSFVPSEKGIYDCFVRIDDSPVTYDNTMYFSINVSESVNVIVISGKEKVNPSLDAMFRKEPLFQYTATNVNRLQSGLISKNNLLILDAVETPGSGLIQEIVTFTQNGGSVVIIPPAKENANGLQPLMSALGIDTYGKLNPAALRISELNLGHELFKGVFDGVPKDMDLPAVRKYFSIAETGLNWKLPLMKLQNSAPFLLMSNSGNGRVYWFASAFDQEFTDFHRHPIVVPVFYQMAFLSKKQTDIYYTIGKNQPVAFIEDTDNNKVNAYKITNKEKSVDFIPQLRNDGNRMFLFVHNMIDRSGNYYISEQNEQIQGVSFNYDRNESVMNFYGTSQLDSLKTLYKLKNIDILQPGDTLSADIQILIQGKQLWKTFLILALLFLAIEVILLRFWK